MINTKSQVMRLYPDEKQALDKALQDVEDEVYLFGSRVDDSKKGGDIDILIYSKENMTKEQQAFVNTLTMVRIK
jgi:predicted nucleotidyltransferase